MFQLLRKSCLPALCTLLLGVWQPTLARAGDAAPPAPKGKVMRVGAAQPRNRTIDYRLPPAEALARVDAALGELEALVHKAGDAGCDALALPEDTLGLLKWEVANPTRLNDVLPEAVRRMLDRLGKAAAKHRMYLVCCNDTAEPDGTTHNTAFLLGRDGKEVGRYHKVNLPLAEQGRARGDRFPVFPTPDLGTVGMLICYDMVFPEAPRCLALQGADVIFHPTLGGAAIGDEEVSLAAFRTRAVENFVWLVVAQRGRGSMIVSPQGKVVARAEGADGIAVADIDPAGGRQGGDAFNTQSDMRGRLFRERVPAAYGVLTDPNPPVLAKVKSNVTKDEAVRVMAVGLTTGEERFNKAEALARAGKTDEAIALFEKLCEECPTSWIDRAGRERLKRLREQKKRDTPGAAPGIAAAYPGDVGIEKDPRVVFAENFEAKDLAGVTARWETASGPENLSLAPDVPAGSGGKQSLLVTHVGGKGTGGQLYRRLKPGHDKLFARFYVKFDPDCAPIHHFGTHLGGYNPSTPWPQGFAGKRPAGDQTFTVGVEPFGNDWVWDFYSYWCEMRGSPPKGQTWGNSFVRDPKLKVERGKWVCVEFMVKMNTVGDRDGELALWIDGRPIAHLGKGFPSGKWVYDKFVRGGGEGVRWDDARGGPEPVTVPDGGSPFDGFRWRTAKELNLNYVWLYTYITRAAGGHVSRVWFDDVVVATEYIGPIRGREDGGRK